MTNQLKFTPGPWEAVNRDTCQFIYAKGYERAICQVDSYSKGFGPDRDERDANAHLIASAPDIYEALEKQLKNWIELIESGDAGHWDPEEDAHVISMRAVLAKARGEVSQ